MAVPQNRLHTLITNKINRSDAVVEPTVVATYLIEGTKIRICSDHLVKTKEENDQCIKELYRIATYILERSAARNKN